MNILINNLAITGICLFLLGYYFNYREKKIQVIAEKKLQEIKEKYIEQIADRKAKEKREIAKLKAIVEDLEEKHRQILREKSSKPKVIIDEAKTEELVKKAQEKAKKIEEEAKTEADEFLAEQKKEVQTKMVDLVMGVAKKVMVKALTYEDHKELVEKAFAEVEGDITDDDRD